MKKDKAAKSKRDGSGDFKSGAQVLYFVLEIQC